MFGPCGPAKSSFILTLPPSFRSPVCALNRNTQIDGCRDSTEIMIWNLQALISFLIPHCSPAGQEKSQMYNGATARLGIVIKASVTATCRGLSPCRVIRRFTTKLGKAIKAASYDVYFWEHFVDVQEATTEVFQGNQAMTYFVVGFTGFSYPDGLVPGTTYFWRIDDVRADGAVIHKGKIWRFTVLP
jgi:hypothetical protein